MRIKVLPWQDTSSPGALTPERGERDPEPEEWIEIEDDLMTSDLVAIVERDGGWRPPHPRLLPPGRFAHRGPTADEKRGLRARTAPDETGRHSRTVYFRLGRSCAGWGPRQPSTEEFYDAVRAERPTDRQAAILDTWASEAEPSEIIDAWAEGAYTFRELATALHRADIARCRAAITLNRLAS